MNETATQANQARKLDDATALYDIECEFAERKDEWEELCKDEGFFGQLRVDPAQDVTVLLSKLSNEADYPDAFIVLEKDTTGVSALYRYSQNTEGGFEI